MESNIPGILIRRERLKRNWSQEGLCRGICTVSYLSKIEQGKADASQELLSLLLERLDIHWLAVDSEKAKTAARLAEELYDAVFSMEEVLARELLEGFQQARNELLMGENMLDFLLLERLITEEVTEDLSEYTPVMDRRQYGLWLLLNEDYEILLKGWPTALYFIEAGTQSYRNGKYATAIERLQRGDELASRSGAVRAMLQARLILGNCYSDLNEFEQMMAHYGAAEHIAQAIGDEDAVKNIRYNIASTNLEFGHTQEAYEYFRTLKNPNIMSCHKLAICCEKLGKTEEALKALTLAESAPGEYPEPSFALEICSLVRFRLQHRDYLRNPEYGQKLLDCFSRMRAELPKGYALFHLPWVEEWYRSSRQYKQICELLRDFPNTTL